MKINDVKHNHSLTDLLKVLIFSILMLLPFLDVGVRCGYVMFNKNAKDSYSGTTTQQIATPLYNSNELETYTDFVVGNYYVLEWTYQKTNNSVTETILEDTGYNNFKYISYWASNMNSYTINDEENYIDFLTIAFEGDDYQIMTFDSTDDIGSSIKNFRAENTLTNQVLLQCVDTTNLDSIHQDFTYWFNNNLTNFQRYNVQTIENSTLDNVFNYSIDKLTQSELYNWTTQTAIYTGVSTMTTQLGITGSLIPMLVCYWFFITIIYIILDIVIKLFTMLTHAIGSKKA